MAVEHIFDTCLLLQRIDILAVVAQQLAPFLQEPHKVMRRTRQEVGCCSTLHISRHSHDRREWALTIKLFGKGIEDSRVSLEDLNIKHFLRICQIFSCPPEVGIDAVGRTKVGDAARGRDTCARENNDIGGLLEQTNDVRNGVDVRAFGASTEDAADGHLEDAQQVGFFRDGIFGGRLSYRRLT